MKLERLLAELPTMAAAANPDEQIRSVLRPLIERAISIQDSPTPIASKPDECPNCGAPATSTKTPYCSVQCKEQAGFVRQFRKALAEDTIFDPERQAGTGQALWNLQGGGFPRRQMMVPARVIAKVIEREEGKCSVCGGPATEIDHTGSG